MSEKSSLISRVENTNSAVASPVNRLASLGDLREAIITNEAESDAPQVSATAVFRNRLAELNVKKVFVRSMILFLLLILAAQWAYGNYQYRITQEEGPVPLTIAIDQLGTDMPQPPAAPPFPR